MFGEGGLIDRAQEGKQLTEQAQIDEQDELRGAEEYINGVLAGTELPGEEDPTIPPKPETPTIDDAKPNPNEDGPKYNNTTTITDDLDNEVVIPGGFHLDKDSGTKVEEGIVIEDDDGNQFVWIPVGIYNVTTEVDKDEIQDGILTNNLSRRIFTENGKTEIEGDSVINRYYYGESASQDSDGNPIESVAKNQIDAFKTSAIENKGFYIGRYEAGTETERTANTNSLSIPLVQADKYPYVYLTRDQAKIQSETMYNGNEFVTSELVSSYAWDTALNFICQTNEEGYLLATTTNSNYGNIYTRYSTGRTKTGTYTVNGEISDKYSNIYDILGNCYEWTTEYYNVTTNPCVNRGGDYFNTSYNAASRNCYTTNYNGDSNSFRIQLYINEETN